MQCSPVIEGLSGVQATRVRPDPHAMHKKPKQALPKGGCRARPLMFQGFSPTDTTTKRAVHNMQRRLSRHPRGRAACRLPPYIPTPEEKTTLPMNRAHQPTNETITASVEACRTRRTSLGLQKPTLVCSRKHACYSKRASKRGGVEFCFTSPIFCPHDGLPFPLLVTREGPGLVSSAPDACRQRLSAAQAAAGRSVGCGRSCFVFCHRTRVNGSGANQPTKCEERPRVNMSDFCAQLRILHVRDAKHFSWCCSRLSTVAQP